MMKLFEEKQAPSLRDRHAELPELPEGVTVPDDLRGIEHDVVTRRRPVRWLRWAALGLLVATGGVAIALLAGDGTSDQPSVDPTLRDGPGTNSLNMLPVAEEITTDDVTTDFDLWIAHEGPGSHSLNLVTP